MKSIDVCLFPPQPACFISTPQLYRPLLENACSIISTGLECLQFSSVFLTLMSLSKASCFFSSSFFFFVLPSSLLSFADMGYKCRPHHILFLRVSTATGIFSWSRQKFLILLAMLAYCKTAPALQRVSLLNFLPFGVKETGFYNSSDISHVSSKS